MKKLLSLALAAALILALSACGSEPAAIPNPALVLGEKYLFDMDYEQAVLQFDQAIAIEPKNPRVYLGKYAALELSGNHDPAVQALQEAKKKVDRANRGQISATLAAAEISAEEGLAAAAQTYQGLGFREIALLLLRLCVKVYEGAERFVAALGMLEERTEVPTEAAATVAPTGPTVATATATGNAPVETTNPTDDLKEAPISAAEYAQVKAALEKPFTSEDDLIARHAVDKEKYLRSVYIANNTDPSHSYEDFLRGRRESPYDGRYVVHDIEKLSSGGVKQFLAVYKSTMDNFMDIPDVKLPLDSTREVYRVALSLHQDGDIVDLTMYVTSIDGTYKFIPIFDSDLLSSIS